MRLKVADPSTGAAMLIDAKPDRLHNAQGYRITSPNGSSFIISNRFGFWRREDNYPMDPLLIAGIGEAIEKAISPDSE